MTRVAICIPSGDMVHADFAMSIASLTYHCGPVKLEGKEQPPIDIAIVNVKDSLIANGRNTLVEKALELDVEYLFFADSDIALHPWALRQLIAHDKDIVGGTYVQRNPPHLLLGKGLNGKPLPEWMQGVTINPSNLMEVAGLPFGCMLVKADVFRKTREHFYDLIFQTPQFFHEEADRYLIEGEDYFFCRRAREIGYQVWLDWSLSFALRHIGQAANQIPATRIDKENNDE